MIDRVEELVETEEAPEMKRGYPIFTWKQRVLHDLELIDEDRIIGETFELEEQINEAEDENVINDNDDGKVEQGIVVDDEQDEGHIVFGENIRENNYVTDEGSIMNEQNEEEVNNNESELDDNEVMAPEKISTEIRAMTQNVMESLDQEIEDINNIGNVDHSEEDETSFEYNSESSYSSESNNEISNSGEHGVEVQLNTSGRPRRQCSGAGVERLEMSLGNNKEYASVKGKHYQFSMKSSDHPLIRGGKSFMSVAANYLFAQVNEHAQILAKAGIKRFGDQAVAAILSKYKQLNTGTMPGKPVFGCIDPKDITTGEKRRALEAVNLIKKKKVW